MSPEQWTDVRAWRPVGSFSGGEIRDRSNEGDVTGLWISPQGEMPFEESSVSALSELASCIFDRTRALNLTSGAASVHINDCWTRLLKGAGFAWSGESEGCRTYELVAPLEPLFRESPIEDSEEAATLAVSSLPSWYPLEASFATGSAVKLGQYGWLFRSSGIKVNSTSLASRTPEPQVEGDGDTEERILVEDPLRRVARFAALRNAYPLMLEDTMLFIEYFNDDFDSHPILPGPDTKRWRSALASDGVLRIMGRTRHRRAKFVCQLGVLTSDGQYHVFRAERPGRISDGVRISSNSQQNFPYTVPHAFHEIFIPDGATETYAEMSPAQFRNFDYRSDCAEQVSKFLLSRRDTDQVASSRLF